MEQTAGSISLALHGHDLRTAVEAFREAPGQWSPFMVFRAYLNPLCESDVRYVEPKAPTSTEPTSTSTSTSAPTSSEPTK